MPSPVENMVWPWREGAAHADASAARGGERRAAMIQAAVMAIVGAILFWFFRHRVMGLVVWGLAVAVGLAGLFAPAAFAAFQRFGRRFGQWVGEGLTWALLTPFFYLCFVPLRLVRALKGRDPLQRRLRTGEPTYWTPRESDKPRGRYDRQF